MTIGHNRIVNSYGEPVQQSMTLDSRDYLALNTNKLMLGLILEVFPADNEANRSSYQREDRRGYLHTCNVLIVEDGRGTYVPLENVIITPDAVSGLDDYYEKLPRGCSSLVTGQTFNSQLNHIDPYTLDGDWCVVGFLGGSVDQPFVLRWWPHPRNPFDPATSGQRNPNNPSAQATLVQSGRYFHRVNGVEFTVTKLGHIYISTYRANSTLNYGQNSNSSDEGRFPRTRNDDEGGSIKAWIKPSQTFELDWNPPVDGIGVLDVLENEIPQTNPRANGSSRQEQTNTYALLDKDRIDITVPEEIKLLSKQRVLLESQEDTTITVGTDLTVDVSGSTSITITSNLDLSVTGNLDADITGTTGLTGTGPVTVQANSTLDVIVSGVTNITAGGALGLAGASISIGAGGASGTPGSINVAAGGIALGTGTLGGVVGGTPLQAAFAAYATAVAALSATATADTAAWAALNTATAALASAINAAVSSTTTVG